MATKQDLELAKRLLAARVLDEDGMRSAFDFLSQLHEQGKTAPLEAVLYHLGLLPKHSLAVLRAPPVLQSQPFPDYELIEPLGEGGSSIVYREVYTPNGSDVAVKVFDPIQALRPDFLERFQREARILIELEHDNIVQGYELGFAGGLHFFSMDLVDGLTVLEIVDRRGHLENEEALSVALQAARALRYLHGSGYLHRDIKPGNIMLEESGRLQLIDLGLIQDMRGAGAGTEETTTVGTVEYLSPEQARGRDDLDQRSDIYSLGVSLYHMVVGEVPFQGDDEYEVMAKQVLAELDTQKVKTRRISPEVHFFIKKMTSKDRDMRFRSVEETIRTIEGYLPQGIVPVPFGEPPVAAPVAPPVAPPVAKPIAKPVAKPVAKPIAKPVAKPVAKPIAKPVAKPVANPAARPPAPPPVAKPAEPAPSEEAKPAPPAPTPRKKLAPAPKRRSRRARGRGADGDDGAGRRGRRRR